MNLLQLTIETFDKNVETDFTSLKNHLNYIEDHNTVVNGLTFAFFGLTEIIIKRVYLTFELNNIIHTIERVYQSGRCILQCDDLENEEASVYGFLIEANFDSLYEVNDYMEQELKLAPLTSRFENY